MGTTSDVKLIRVYLRDDSCIPGSRTEMGASGVQQGDECPSCGAVRHAKRGGNPEERRRSSDATVPVSRENGFVIVK